MGCAGLEPKPELACVRKVTAATLENALSNYGISGVKPAISFVPIADETVVFANSTDRAVKGLVAKIVSFSILSLMRMMRSGQTGLIIDTASNSRK